MVLVQNRVLIQSVIIRLLSKLPILFGIILFFSPRITFAISNSSISIPISTTNCSEDFQSLYTSVELAVLKNKSPPKTFQIVLNDRILTGKRLPYDSKKRNVGFSLFDKSTEFGSAMLRKRGGPKAFLLINFLSGDSFKIIRGEKGIGTLIVRVNQSNLPLCNLRTPAETPTVFPTHSETQKPTAIPQITYNVSLSYRASFSSDAPIPDLEVEFIDIQDPAKPSIRYYTDGTGAIKFTGIEGRSYRAVPRPGMYGVTFEPQTVIVSADDEGSEILVMVNAPCSIPAESYLPAEIGFGGIRGSLEERGYWAGINDAGDVAGYFVPKNFISVPTSSYFINGISHYFFSSNLTVSLAAGSIRLVNGDLFDPKFITESGKIVGNLYVTPYPNTDYVAMMYDPITGSEQVFPMLTLGDSQRAFSLRSVNNKNVAVGQYSAVSYTPSFSFISRPVASDGTSTVLLGPDNINSGAAMGINDAGTIVGWINKPAPNSNGSAITMPVEFMGNSVRYLPFWQDNSFFKSGSADAINDAGTIVGSIFHAGYNAGPVLWSSSTEPPVLIGSNLERPTSISSRGVIVGERANLRVEYLAQGVIFQYCPILQMVTESLPAQTILDSSQRYQVNRIYDVNRWGNIVATAYRTDAFGNILNNERARTMLLYPSDLRRGPEIPTGNTGRIIVSLKFPSSIAEPVRRGFQIELEQDGIKRFNVTNDRGETSFTVRKNIQGKLSIRLNSSAMTPINTETTFKLTSETETIDILLQ